jgi:alpha-glucoside transport system permease protein
VASPTIAETVKVGAKRSKDSLTSPWASVAVILLAVLWTIPTFGLLVTSFRPAVQIQKSGWWTIFTDPSFTLDNYRQVLDTESSGSSIFNNLVNSVIITIPAVVIPITIAILAAYAFAWIEFPFKNFLFVVIFALQIVPIQVTLIPLLSLYVDAGLAGTFWTIWISHSIFALPLAIFLFHNFMRDIPRELVEAARVDGANHVRIFLSVMRPLLTPAIAAFAIFQFLWVWNDLLVALTFGGSENSPMTVALSNLSGTRGTAWYLLSAGAFVSMLVPVVVFLSLQRYFVRGLLAGSVKG